MNSLRLARFQNILLDHGLDAFAINPGPSFRYFTGMDFHLMERPVVLVIPAAGKSTVILPNFETSRFERFSSQINLHGYSDNPAEWERVFSAALSSMPLAARMIGVEPLHLRLLEYHFLKSALPACDFIPSAEAIYLLRSKKTVSEIECMRKAVRIAQAAFLSLMPYIKKGVTEKELAAELTIQLLKAGSDPTLPFNPIIASGPNSANPHAEPTERFLQKGDLVVIDWGASWEGCFSDLTRTLSIGKPSEENLRIATLVAESNQAAFCAARPGIPAGIVDKAAREVIGRAGYGNCFTHRTGHGLGLEAHEPPYLFGENTVPLEIGNTHSIEPGIYIPGMGGVRIEDDVAITSEGAECLSDLSRELWIIPAD